MPFVEPQGLGVPHSCGLTSPARPNPFRSRAADTHARYASPLQRPFAPGTPLRCSTANLSSVPRNRVARDCDARNSVSPSNVDPIALCARPHGRKLFDHARAPRRSKHALCAHAAIPARAAKLLGPAFPPARDNDSATRTTQTSGSRSLQTQSASRAKNYPCAQGCGRRNDDGRNRMTRLENADARSWAGAAANAEGSRAFYARLATPRVASH